MEATKCIKRMIIVTITKKNKKRKQCLNRGGH